jgi:TonB family protein
MDVTMRYFPLLLLLPLYGMPAPLAAQVAEVEARAADPAAMSRELTHRYPQYFEHVGIGGVVRLKAFIDAAGKADSVYVTSSSGVAALDRAAANVARTGRYIPARGASGAIGSWTDVELQFGAAPVTPAAAHPRVANRDTLLDAVQAHIPADLRRQQIGTAVVVHLTVDGAGNVIRTAVPDPGCFPSAVDAALAAAGHIRFEPGDGTPSATSQSVATVAFYPDSVRLTFLGDSEEPPKPPPAATGAGATRRPELRNLPAVQQALQRRLGELQRQGVSGELRVWAFVDERGQVTTRVVSEPTGICALDMAALDVTRIMRFSPALRNGERVGVWVELPVHFNNPRGR